MVIASSLFVEGRSALKSHDPRKQSEISYLSIHTASIYLSGIATEQTEKDLVNKCAWDNMWE